MQKFTFWYFLIGWGLNNIFGFAFQLIIRFESYGYIDESSLFLMIYIRKNIGLFFADQLLTTFNLNNASFAFRRIS